METSKKVPGSEHPDTLISMGNLAHTYKLEDRHDEALDLMRDVVNPRTQNIDANHGYATKARGDVFDKL